MSFPLKSLCPQMRIADIQQGAGFASALLQGAGFASAPLYAPCSMFNVQIAPKTDDFKERKKTTIIP